MPIGKAVGTAKITEVAGSEPVKVTSVREASNFL